MTLAQVEQCSEVTARTLTDQLRQSLVISWELLVEAYQRRAWAALGYESWDAYTDAELGETRLRLPREERREVVASMTEAGMSTRAIGAAIGISDMQVRRDKAAATYVAPGEPIEAEIVDDPWSEPSPVRGEPDDIPLPPLRVVGTDGKSYPATPQPATPRRKPITEAFWQATYDLTKAIERVERLADDDRFLQNAEKVAAVHRNDLLRAIDALHGVVNRLPAA